MDYMQSIKHWKGKANVCVRASDRHKAVATPGLLVAIGTAGWALAAVVSVVMTAVWFHGSSLQPLPAAAADHALLLAVERSLQSECPVALRPAALLAAEAEQGGAAGRGADTLKGEQL